MEELNEIFEVNGMKFKLKAPNKISLCLMVADLSLRNPQGAAAAAIIFCARKENGLMAFNCPFDGNIMAFSGKALDYLHDEAGFTFEDLYTIGPWATDLMISKVNLTKQVVLDGGEGAQDFLDEKRSGKE